MSEESTLTASMLAEHQPVLQQESIHAMPNENRENIKQVIIDDDDDEEDDSFDGPGLPYADHNYDTCDPSKRVKDSTVFPVCTGLTEFGIVLEDESAPSVDSNNIRSEKQYIEHPNIVFTNRRDQISGGVVYRSAADPPGATRKVLIGGNNYTFNPASGPAPVSQGGVVPHGFKAVPRAPEYSAGSGVSAQYVVGGYSSPMRRSLGPMGPAPNVTMQKKPGRPKNIVRSPMQQPPNATPSDPPPHRALLTGKSMAPAPPPPPVYQTQTVVPMSNQLTENTVDPMQTPKGGAPLLVAGRGAKPMIRGRAGAGISSTRKADMKATENMLEDVLADDSQNGNPIAPRPSSPRKMVQFSDGNVPGSSSLSTVNVVVGAPPQPLNNTPQPTKQFQEGQEVDRESETQRAVEENVQAIHARTFQQQSVQQHGPQSQLPVAVQQAHMHQLPMSPDFTLPNVHREPRTPQSMPPEVKEVLSKGESCTRMLNFKTLCNAKQATPDLPPDLFQPEVRPRGRPKGSTNRSRESRTSLSASGISCSPGGGGSPGQVHTTPQATTQLPGASPRRSSPMKYATSPQRAISVKSPVKTPQQSDDCDALPPLVPPAVPSLGANAPSPAHTFAHNGDTPQINPTYTPRAVYNIPVTSPPVSLPQPRNNIRKSESINLDNKGEVSTTSLASLTIFNETEPVPPFSNGLKEASSAEESAGEDTDSDKDSDESSSIVSNSTEDESAAWGDYITRCNCGLTHSDDFMIQCERCDVWQHIKCMGLNTKHLPKTYYCEQCDPRPLKWNREQARDYQQKQVKALQKATEKRRQERRARRKRKEEANRAKMALTKGNKKIPSGVVSGLQYRKFNEITMNTYSKMANNLLRVYASTEGAEKILADVHANASKFGRMFVAPAIEGIVAVDDIAKSSLVMEFIGNVCLPSECPGRKSPGMVQPYTILYNGLSEQDSLLVLDARKTGDDSRFVRRSCRPNTVLRHVMHQEGIHVLLTATELIQKSVEITIPFDSDYSKCIRPLQCACGDESTCPIADFNNKLVTHPENKKKSSISAKRELISRPPVGPTRDHKAKSEKEEPAPPGKRGRPLGATGRKGMIKLRRPERKTKDEEEHEQSETDNANVLDKGTVKKEKKTEAVKKEESEEPIPSSSEDKSESNGKRRESRRLRRETEKEEKLRGEEEKEEEKKPERKKKNDTEKGKDDKKIEKEDLEEGELADEEEPVVRKRTRAFAVTSVKNEKQDVEEKGVRGRRALAGRDKTKEETTASVSSPASVVSPRKERKRRESENKDREEMDYTLPEDRNKTMSREDRKLAASIALIEKLDQQQKEHESHKRKSVSPLKEKRARRASVSDKNIEKERKEKEEKEKEKKRKEKEREREKKKAEKEKQKKEEKEKSNKNKVTRTSPRSPRKDVEVKEETVPVVEEQEEERTTIIAAPPRKRWQQEQEMKEEAEMSSPSRDVAPYGKKAWLLRRAQAEKDEPAPPDPAPTVQSPVFGPRSPTASQLSPPLKKRRPFLETTCETDALSRNEAAELLTQMAGITGAGTSSMPTPDAYEPPLRDLMRNFARSLIASNSRELVFELPSDGFPEVSAPLRKKRLSIDDYRKRKVPQQLAVVTLSSPSESSNKKKSFIPSIQDSEGTLLLAPVPDPSVLGSPLADLDELRKRIYGQSSGNGNDLTLPPPPPEPRLEPPPPPPSIPRNNPQKGTQEGMRTRGSPQKNSTTDGESVDEEHPRMSLADRLKHEFGI